MCNYDYLVKRLRDDSARWADGDKTMCNAAADAIESLQATLNDHLASESAETMRADKAQTDLANLQVAFNDWKVFHSTIRLEVELAAARAECLRRQTIIGEVALERDAARALLRDCLPELDGEGVTIHRVWAALAKETK